MNGIGLQWVGINPSVTLPASCHRSNSMETIARRSAYLKSVSLFAGLNDEELRFLAEETRERTYDTDAILFYQGEVGHTCHIIMRGKVRVFVVGDDGHELSVCILGPGEIIGEMAMFEEVPRSANIQALEPTTTLELHQDVLLRGLQRSPNLALSLLRALSSRLRNTTEDAEKLVSLTVGERLLARLQRLADWAGRPTPDGTRIAFPMTQQQLAALVGTSRESVNRALAGLRREGKVRLEDGWLILMK